MSEQRTDDKTKWIIVEDDNKVHVNCLDCAFTVKSYDFDEYNRFSVNLEDLKNMMPNICPKCKRTIESLCIDERK